MEIVSSPRKPLSAADARAVAEIARRLRDSEAAGERPALLKGKHLALLCLDTGCQPSELFFEAATALGARVSRLDPETLKLASGTGPRDALPLLAKLYDAVECDHASPALTERLKRSLNVPVFDGIAHDDHPLMALASAPGDAAERRRLVQALLVHRIG